MNDGMTDDKPAGVPAKANQRWIWPSAIDWTGTESPAGTLGERTQSGSSSKEPPLTGEPDAGDPHVRFGGRGKVLSLVRTLSSCIRAVAQGRDANLVLTGRAGLVEIACPFNAQACWCQKTDCL